MTEPKKRKAKTGGAQGSLYVVATPIGNPLDWTERAKQVLSQVPVIAAEDTRVLKRLLSKIDVSPKRVFSYRDGNEEASALGLIEILKCGEDVALVSDAGTPLISDPGYHIVNQTRLAGIAIVPVPGVSSITAALSVSGLGGKTVYFGGFLPSQKEARLQALMKAKNVADTLVFFEAPHRLTAAIADAATVFGETSPIVVCRELTKSYEEILSLPINEALAHFNTNEPRGEFVLLFKGGDLEKLELPEVAEEIKKLLAAGFSASDILEKLQPQTQIPRKELYRLIVRAKGQPFP